MAMVTVRYWAAARQAAGVPEEVVAGQTLADVLAAILAERADQPAPRRLGTGHASLAAVLARSSFLVDGQQVGRRAPETVQLSAGAVIEVLPPFAGG